MIYGIYFPNTSLNVFPIEFKFSSCFVNGSHYDTETVMVFQKMSM